MQSQEYEVKKPISTLFSSKLTGNLGSCKRTLSKDSQHVLDLDKRQGKKPLAERIANESDFMSENTLVITTSCEEYFTSFAVIYQEMRTRYCLWSYIWVQGIVNNVIIYSHLSHALRTILIQDYFRDQPS